MKRNIVSFLRDELILFSPLLVASAAVLLIGILIPRDLFLLSFLLMAALLTAGLMSFLPPVRAARARLVAGRYLPAGDR